MNRRRGSRLRSAFGIGALSLSLLVVVVLITSCTTGDPQIDRSASAETAEGTIEGLRSLQSSFRAIADDVIPSVVRLDVTNRVASFGGFGSPDQEEPRGFEAEGLGSGVIVSKDGTRYFVLTNDHVVGSAEAITVVLDDGSEFSAELAGRDPRKDLAMVTFDALRSIPVARLGDSDTLQVGDWVVAIGSPFGFQNTLTAGIVSALGRSGAQIRNVSDFIQTDAAINRGNSGGALVNLDGDVVGINTWITSETGVSAGLGFAIPINNVIRTLETFLAGEEIEYGWLGVSIQTVDRDQVNALGLRNSRGALIDSVFSGSPAVAAGIQPGDFVVAVDGTEIRSSDEFVLRVGELTVGTETVLRLYRQGEQIDVPVTIQSRESDARIRQSYRELWPGMRVSPITDRVAADRGLEGVSGAIVTNVEAGGPADFAGLEPGDVIQEMNGEPIAGVLDFYRSISEDGIAEWLMIVSRNGAELTLTVDR